MERKPKNPKGGMLNGMMFFILIAAVLDVISSLGLFIWTLKTTGDVAKARTMAVTSAIFFELFFVFNCRSEKNNFLKNDILSNKKLVAAVMASILLQVSIIYIPLFQEVFGMVGIGLTDWIKVLFFSSVGLLIVPEIFMRENK